ncbi:MAG: hypothetical protein UY12_C0005G0006 [Parcubacteria group bacterium GW2011_GWA2_47_8b]|nr:MAG: hypothetical protein UY12_C0005G0006 [Parcubacteria group bacterium GW2011_GWA2_47_8b]
MRQIWSIFKTGLLALIPILVLAILLGWIWSGIRAVSLDILKVCSNVPIVSIVTNFLFNHEYIERVAKGDLPEVLFRHTNESWTIGTVTNELKLPEDLDADASGPLVDWVVILAPPTAPLSVAAPVHLRKKSTVIYTGRLIRDTALSVASFGLNFQLDPKKFSRAKPV